MRIRLATALDQPDWDAYVLAHPEGLAYQLYAWRLAVAEAYHFDACYLMAEEDGRIHGVLPLIDFKPPLFGRCYLSLPYCDQGGCLADDDDTEHALLARAVDLASEKRISSIELRQCYKTDAEDRAAMACTKVRMVLDLPVNSSAMLAGMKSKLRSQVLKPHRDGLSFRLGGSELVEEFYAIYSVNMRDLGSPVHSRQWIESVVAHFGANARVGVVSTPSGEPAAAGIILLHPRTVSIPWASALRKFKRWNANMLLYWSLLAFCTDQGYRRFDFGRSTPGEGTYRFKQQWGAKPVPLRWRKMGQDDGGQTQRTHKPRLRGQAERIWKRLPQSLCNSFGPRLRRYVSL